MALDLKLNQTQKLSQRMIESVSILQMTAQELQGFLVEEMLENPVLEIAEKDHPSVEDAMQRQSALEEEHYLTQRSRGDDDYDMQTSWNISADTSESLKDHLRYQLMHREIPKADIPILLYILENLEPSGWFTEDMDETAALLHTSRAHVESVLSLLQGLEPAGICARNLEECLRLQLAALGQLTEDAEQVIGQCLMLAAKKKYAAISKQLDIPVSRVQAICGIISGLDPRPGSHYAMPSDARVSYIIPDIYLVSGEEGTDIQLNDRLCPDISVNGYYQQLEKESTEDEIREYLGDKIRRVEWIRHCIEQRNTTLLHVSREILKKQREFFEADGELKPLRMSEVAEAAGVHESTVSRAVDKKYLQCRRGVFPMGYFFQKSAAAKGTAASKGGAAAGDTAAANAGTNGATNVTGMRIKALMAELIADEPKTKPYSDRALCEQLAAHGITISRRTVAKYRAEAGIPDASGRKQR